MDYKAIAKREYIIRKLHGRNANIMEIEHSILKQIYHHREIIREINRCYRSRNGRIITCIKM